MNVATSATTTLSTAVTITSTTLHTSLQHLATAFQQKRHRLADRTPISLLQLAKPGLDIGTASKILTGATTLSDPELDTIVSTLNTWMKEIGLPPELKPSDIRKGIPLPPPKPIEHRPMTAPAPILATNGSVSRPRPQPAEQPQHHPPAKTASQDKKQPPGTLLPERLEYLLFNQHGGPDAFCRRLGIQRANYYLWRTKHRCSKAALAALGVTDEELVRPLTQDEWAQLARLNPTSKTSSQRQYYRPPIAQAPVITTYPAAEEPTTPPAESLKDHAITAEPSAPSPQPAAEAEQQDTAPPFNAIKGTVTTGIKADTLDFLVGHGHYGQVLLAARQFIDTLQGPDRDLALIFLGCESSDGQ